MPEDMNVTTYDGRAYLNAVDKQYDVIMVDAYQDITIPFQMSSLEFFTMVRAHLKEDGVMVVNMNMRGDKEEGSITQYLSDTICAVFPSVWTADVRYSTNRELFAALKPGAMETFQRNVALCADPELRDMLMLVSSGLKTCEGGEHIMTDDRAPVELLGMRVIDDLIRDEISWVREIYDREGIQGVINSI